MEDLGPNGQQAETGIARVHPRFEEVQVSLRSGEVLIQVIKEEAILVHWFARRLVTGRAARVAWRLIKKHSCHFADAPEPGHRRALLRDLAASRQQARSHGASAVHDRMWEG
jgi:hypothetical protein